MALNLKIATFENYKVKKIRSHNVDIYSSSMCYLSSLS